MRTVAFVPDFSAFPVVTVTLKVLVGVRLNHEKYIYDCLEISNSYNSKLFCQRTFMQLYKKYYNKMFLHHKYFR